MRSGLHPWHVPSSPFYYIWFCVWESPAITSFSVGNYIHCNENFPKLKCVQRAKLRQVTIHMDREFLFFLNNLAVGVRLLLAGMWLGVKKNRETCWLLFWDTCTSRCGNKTGNVFSGTVHGLSILFWIVDTVMLHVRETRIWCTKNIWHRYTLR